MPRIGGIEAAPRLKTLLPQTPIILFTLHGSLPNGCDTREIGVDAVIAKQDGLSALGDSIHTLFARSPQLARPSELFKIAHPSRWIGDTMAVDQSVQKFAHPVGN